MALCKMTQADQKTLDNLVSKFNDARFDIVNFLEELKGEWESALEDKSDDFQESQPGQDAQSRISILEGWLDEVANDFELDISEVS